MNTDTRTEMTEISGGAPARIPVYRETGRRRNNANMVNAVCGHFSFRPQGQLVCLDLGSSTGASAECFADYFEKVIALDIDGDNLKWARENRKRENIEYLCSDGTEIALADSSIDVVICDRSFEHVERRQEMLSEIYRVLKYDGFCYFGAGNRYGLIGRRGNYGGRSLSLGKLKSLTRNFWRHDYTNMILENPEEFHVDDIIRRHNIISRLPRRIFTLIYPYFAAWVWVLTKRK